MTMDDEAPRVLLVNDDPSTLFTLKTLLANIDVRLSTATSGTAALRQMLHHDFALVILDIKMPDMDGFETARLIRQRPRNRHTPIIFLTAHRATDLDQATGYGVGALDYLFMPVLPDVLRAKVKAYAELGASAASGRDEDELRQEARGLRDQLNRPGMVNEALRHELDLRRQDVENLPAAAVCRQVVEHAGGLVGLADSEGRWLYVSPASQLLLGERAESGEDVFAAVAPEDRPAALEAFQRAAERGERGRAEYRLVLGEDDVRVLDTEFTSVGEGAERQVVLASRDITDSKQAEAHIVHMAYHDALTGLPNRLLLQDRMKLALAHQRRQQAQAAVLFVDLDRFKDVNDTLGHAVGDRLLQEVAERLQACVRTGDTVARLGGDEFVLLLDGIGEPGQAALVAGKIVSAISAPIRIGQEIRVSPSVGIAIYPQDGSSIEELLRHADMAMIHAKQEGRGRYSFFTPEMNRMAAKRLALGSAMQGALQNREFILHYQPKVRLASGEISGFEALMRWPQADGSLIPPGDFIPIAEETGRVVALGDWALEEACQQLRRWRAAGLQERPVAVNLSARHFRRDGLVQSIEAVLREANVPPQALEAELTESAVMADPHRAVRTLDAMRELGVSIAIDDFGTGYSSLAYLKRFPIDKLKIDAAFVRDITTDPDDAAIASAIISLAHSLDIQVIAEGVETAEQVQFLAEHGCDEVQGFYFSRAVPADAVGTMLASGRIPH